MKLFLSRAEFVSVKKSGGTKDFLFFLHSDTKSEKSLEISKVMLFFSWMEMYFRVQG